VIVTDETCDTGAGQTDMAQAHERQSILADEALQRLIDGNRRFRRGAAHFPTAPETLANLANGQRPYATILGCADSRVPPELIFGAGLGELFVVRVAGNVLSAEVAGSLQYAGAHLHTPLVVVLGHEGCGAVAAALDTKLHGARQHSRIQMLVDSMLPALEDVDPHADPPAQLAQAVDANVRWTIAQILGTQEGQARLAEGRMKLVGAIYEIVTGRVRFLQYAGR
jgi:carbonic anhydrase